MSAHGLTGASCIAGPLPVSMCSLEDSSCRTGFGLSFKGFKLELKLAKTSDYFVDCWKMPKPHPPNYIDVGRDADLWKIHLCTKGQSTGCLAAIRVLRPFTKIKSNLTSTPRLTATSTRSSKHTIIVIEKIWNTSCTWKQRDIQWQNTESPTLAFFFFAFGGSSTKHTLSRGVTEKLPAESFVNWCSASWMLTSPLSSRTLRRSLSGITCQKHRLFVCSYFLVAPLFIVWLIVTLSLCFFGLIDSDWLSVFLSLLLYMFVLKVCFVCLFVCLFGLFCFSFYWILLVLVVQKTPALLKKAAFWRCSGSWRCFSRMTKSLPDSKWNRSQRPSAEVSDIMSAPSLPVANSPDPNPNNSVLASMVMEAALHPTHKAASHKCKAKLPALRTILAMDDIKFKQRKKLPNETASKKQQENKKQQETARIKRLLSGNSPSRSESLVALSSRNLLEGGELESSSFPLHSSAPRFKPRGLNSLLCVFSNSSTWSAKLACFCVQNSSRLPLASRNTDLVLWLGRSLKLLQFRKGSWKIWEGLDLVLTISSHAEQLGGQKAAEKASFSFAVANACAGHFPSWIRKSPNHWKNQEKHIATKTSKCQASASRLRNGKASRPSVKPKKVQEDRGCLLIWLQWFNNLGNEACATTVLAKQQIHGSRVRFCDSWMINNNNNNNHNINNNNNNNIHITRNNNSQWQLQKYMKNKL